MNHQKSTDVAIVMGSESDLIIMSDACKLLDYFKITYFCTIISAHRTPERLYNFAKNATHNDFKIIIAGASGAAHLPGMIASLTTLPVIGVPIKTTILGGQDSLLSIVQMPKDVPVATVGINNSFNAAMLACRILSIESKDISIKLSNYNLSKESEIMEKATLLENKGHAEYLNQRVIL